jgi:hypothetical protein
MKYLTEHHGEVVIRAPQINASIRDFFALLFDGRAALLESARPGSKFPHGTVMEIGWLLRHRSIRARCTAKAET